MTLGERVRQLRTERGLTHTQLGDMLAPRTDRGRPSGRSYIYQVESDTSSPTLGYLEKMAAAFGMSVLELLAPIYGQQPEQQSPWIGVHHAMEEIRQSVSHLDTAIRDVKVRDFARLLEAAR